MSKNIVVIGSSNIDLIMKMERVPKLGETVTEGEFSQVFGGKGANQAVGAARSGGQVTFISCVGDDAFGSQMIEGFKKDGINTEFVTIEQDVASGTALIMIDSDGHNAISVAPGANFRLKEQHIDSATAAMTQAEIILLQYEILPGSLEYAIHKGHELGKKVALNLAPARSISEKTLSRLSILIVNEIEAEFLTSIPADSAENIRTAASVLLDKGIETVIITLGKGGSFIAQKDSSEMVSAYEVEAVDSTAAGDIYCGSLCTALVEGKTMAEAVRFASAAAAISVTRLGAQPSAPSRNEIEKFMDA